ncbi:hypothetical protein TCSYLVIO_009983 [Trypanosoma cruzi]|nr:hypothetical protein TCSYLVIO_009983 [Trypanosoma cruzi]
MPMTSFSSISHQLNGVQEHGHSPLLGSRPVSSGVRSGYEAIYPSPSKPRRESVFFLAQTPKPIDFYSAEAQEAMEVLRRLLCPVIMRRVLRIRKRKRWPGENAMRVYTTNSIHHALRSSDSIIADWPDEVFTLIAEEALYFYLEPNEIIVYMNESYISSGVVVLLYGEVKEQKDYLDSSTSLTRPHICRHVAPAVFCDQAVLCRDVSTSLIAANGYADVAVLPARWVWNVINSYVLQHSGGCVLDCLKFSIAPICEEIVNKKYFPTSLVLRRSWMWSLFSSRDRIRLARLMTVKVFCIGDTLFCEGDYYPYMHIIRRGIVKVVVKNQPLLELDLGSSFGEVSILFDEPRCCRAVASTMCEVYCLHRKHLVKYLRKKPQLYNAVIQTALERRELWLEEGKNRNIMGLAGLLAGVPCLSQSTEKVRISLAMAAKPHLLPPNQTLFAKDTLCDQLFIIGRGSVMLVDGNGDRVVRSTVDFVGEFCLHPHRWPTNVVTCTSVDGWSLSVTEIMSTLSTINAGAQAVEICRQGIELYRAQHGSNSVIEEITDSGSHLPTVPDAVDTVSLAKRETLSYTGDSRAPAQLPSSLLEQSERKNIDFDWNAYAMKDKSALPLEDEEGTDVSKRSERREFEQNVENELGWRVGGMISVPSKKSSSAVDCDFSADVDEMQQVLVEQIFLMPTERQPILLRQINQSKITLIFDDELEPLEELSSENTTANNLALPQYVVPSPVVYTLDGITAYSDGNPLPVTEAPPIISPRTGLDFAATTTRRRSHTPEVQLSPPGQFGTQRLFEELGSLTLRSRPQSGVPSHSRSLRPTSGFSLRRTPPRAASAGCNQRLSRSVSFCSRTSAMGTLTVSQVSENISTSAQGNASSWTKANSIDLSQKAKITASMFQSALDRYVKLDNQSYFQEMVRVCLPSQPEEQWFEEDTRKLAKKKEGLVLLLMHVRSCKGIDIDKAVKSPIVKVSTNTRVLMRTPVMENLEEPVWPIETASFIHFIHADSEVYFKICDAEDEDKIAYSATLPTSDIRENGGVGLRSLPMQAEELGLSESTDDIGARIEVCMMAVTASKYSSLNKRLDDHDDEDSSEDGTTVYLQILGVHGLKHRIEAVIRVSVEGDGQSREILRTPKAFPKTRSPSWPGQGSFCAVKSDGVVSFDLYHRDAFLASYETPADILAFGGTGIYTFPLLRAQGGPDEVYGSLSVSILGLKATSVERQASCRPSRVLLLHLESLHLTSDLEEFTPDPFVIVRGVNGEVILRTAFSFSTHNVKWTEDEASCFIMCPTLEGCSVIYRLEVYDNNESNKIGTAEVTVTSNGTRRHRMELPVGTCGALTVVSHSFPVQEVPRPPPSRRGSLLNESNEEGFLLSIDVRGCDNLQGTGFDDLQIDPLVTARIGRRRVLVAPLVSGSTVPRWAYPKATFVLPVLPELLSHFTLEVWDTNIELSDVLGVARISIKDLCRTGTHHFPLQPHKDQEFGRRQNLGTITLKTRFGRMNGEIISDGSSDLLLTGSSRGGGMLDTRLFQTPGDATEIPVTRVCVHISSCSALQTDVSIKFIKVTMSCLQHVLLEVKKEYDASSSVAWSIGEAHTVIDLRSIHGRPLCLSVACSSFSSVNDYTDVGSALVSFSTLVSASEVISVHSFFLTDSPSGEEGVGTIDNVDRTRGTSVSVDTPTVTITLLALEMARPLSTGSG